MSADNWTACPRCLAQHVAEIGTREQEIERAYGRVDVEKFDELRNDLENFRGAGIEPTFREDYELGVLDGGEFFVRYSGGCRECGLTHEFSTDQKLAIEATR